MIHRNRYGFIKDQSIQNCLAWSFEYLFLCKQTKKEMVILKLDSEKVFDKLEQEIILNICIIKSLGKIDKVDQDDHELWYV